MPSDETAPAGDPLGYDTLHHLATTAAATESLLDHLLASVRTASPGPLQDDWTVLLLERR